MEMKMLNYTVVVEEAIDGRFIAWCPAFDCIASEAASFEEAVEMLREGLTRHLIGRPDVEPGEC